MGYAFSNCSEQLASSSKLSPRKKLFSSQGVFRFSVVGWVNGCVSCVLHYAAHLPASSALQKQWGLCSKARIAPATLLLDVCGVCLLFFFIEYFVTWTLPFSGEGHSAFYFSLPYFSLPPSPTRFQQVRDRPVTSTMQMGTQPQRGEVALEILKVNTARTQLSHISSPAIGGFNVPCTQMHWLHRF